MALLLTPPHCSQRPALSPSCNVAAYIDQRIMGWQHMYPFPTCRHAKPPCPYLDPEVIPAAPRDAPQPRGCPAGMTAVVLCVPQGLFATLGGASISTLIGLWFGTVLLTLKTHRWETLFAILKICLYPPGATYQCSSTIQSFFKGRRNAWPHLCLIYGLISCFSARWIVTSASHGWAAPICVVQGAAALLGHCVGAARRDGLRAAPHWRRPH